MVFIIDSTQTIFVGFFVKVDEVKLDGYGFGNPIHVTENLVDSDDIVVSDLDCPVNTFVVNTCAIIRDEDCDFGNVQTCPSLQSSNELLPSQRIDPSCMSHLNGDERQQNLLKVLDSFPDVFKDEPGLYKGIKHTVPTVPDFRARRLREYKIPEKIKPQVMSQIRGLLDLGVIKHSTLPSTLICSLKGRSSRDGVRLASLISDT